MHQLGSFLIRAVKRFCLDIRRPQHVQQQLLPRERAFRRGLPRAPVSLPRGSSGAAGISAPEVGLRTKGTPPHSVLPWEGKTSSSSAACAAKRTHVSTAACTPASRPSRAARGRAREGRDSASHGSPRWASSRSNSPSSSEPSSSDAPSSLLSQSRPPSASSHAAAESASSRAPSGECAETQTWRATVRPASGTRGPPQGQGTAAGTPVCPGGRAEAPRLGHA